MGKNDDNNIEVTKGTITKWLILGILFVGMIILLSSVSYTIQTGERGVLLTWGRAQTTAVMPGFHFKIPLAQQVVKFDTRTQIYGADASGGTYESAASKDLQVVKANIAVNYHVDPNSVPDLYAAVGSTYESTVITPAVHDALKSTTAQYTAEELITKREDVRSGIQEVLKQKLLPYHLVVESVNIVKFDFSDQFNTAIEAKVTAEQQKEKAVNDLARIQVEAEQQVATANGARDAAIAQAQGVAKTTELTALADAEKVRLINEQLRTTPEYIEYIKAQRWDGHLPVQFNGNGVSPFVDMRGLLATTSSGGNSS